MNEDLLLAIFEKEGFKAKGLNFDEFKVDMQNEVLQQEIFKRAGFETKGIKFDEFVGDLGFTQKKINTTPTLKFSPVQHALLDAISDVESSDYNVIVSPKGKKLTFSDYSKHPNIVGVTTEFGKSTAAGKLQFTKETWDDVNKVLNLPDFSPDSQNIAGLYYAETRYRDLTGGRNIYQDIEDGKLENIQQVLGGTGRATVWQGLQGDKEFPNRFKSHLSRYEALVKDNEKELTPQQKLEESVKGFEGAVKTSQEQTKDLRYDLGTTEIPQSVDKKLPKSLEETKDSLDAERKRLDEVNRKYKQAHLTRQEELLINFKETPIHQQISKKYNDLYIQGRDKYVEENIKTNPEYIGFSQKLQDDLNRGLLNEESANQKLNDYLNEKVQAAPELKDLSAKLDKQSGDELNPIFNGYVSKDNIISDLNAQAESIFGKSKSFQQELLNQYNTQVDEYNKSAKATQNKGSRPVGLSGGGPYAPGKRPQDYTGGLTKANMTSQDYQEKIDNFGETSGFNSEMKKLYKDTGFDKSSVLSLYYKNQGLPVPAENSKEYKKKQEEFFKKGYEPNVKQIQAVKELKLKQHEVLKEEIFTLAPVELGRASIKDYNKKVEEYGDEQRGLYEQDKVAYKSYYDNHLAKFKETADIVLSERFGERYTDFNEQLEAIDILKKSGKDVTAKVKAVQEDYKDILADDDYILSTQGVSDLYKAAKFEEDQLADKYQQGERLRNIDEEQAWANNNPVISTILNTVAKTIGAGGQMYGSVLEQAQKFNIPVPGFAILSGFAAKGAKELGERISVAGSDLKEASQFTTKMQGQSRETFATTPSGKRVVYDANDPNAKPIYIRNEDGTIYEGFEADKIIASAEGLKKETGWNLSSGLGQLLDVAAYMIPTVALSYGSAGVGAGIGLQTAGLNAASKIGMFMGGFGQSYADVKQEGLRQKNLSLDEIEVLAGLTGVSNGVIENFNNIEGVMFTKRLPKNVISENLINMASGKISRVDAFNNLVQAHLKPMAVGAFKESFLEEVPQQLTENAFKNYYNVKKGSEFNVSVSTDKWYDIIATSMVAGVIGDGIRSGRGSDLGKESLKTIVNNRDMFDAFIGGMEKTDPERAAKLRSDIEPLLTEIDAIDGLTPSRKEKSIGLLYDIKVKEAKLATLTEPTLRKPVEDKLVELRKELGSVAQVKTDEKGEPIEDTEETTTTTKPKENAVQEQKTTEVPVQPKTESSTADTQGQPQPKPEGTTQQGKAQEQTQGEEVKQPVESFETAKGSVYTVLPDGKTQRFKTATGEKNDPQDLIVFAKFKDAQQEQDFLSAQNRKNGQKLVVVDKDGTIYNTNEEIKGKDVKLAIIKDGNIIETAEISIDPKIGYNTFDQRRFEKDGEPVRSTHLGNKVTKINYKPTEPVQSTISNQQGVPTTQGENVAPTQPKVAQKANYQLSYANGRTTPAVVKDGKWFLPETGAKSEDGSFAGTFASDAQVKQLNEKFGAADKVAAQPVKKIEPKNIKLKKSADFSSDGTYEVTTNGEVIGKIYYDKERKSWSDEEYVPKDANDIYGNNLGTKEEAIQAMADRYNTKVSEQQPAADSVAQTEVVQKAENPALDNVEATTKALNSLDKDKLNSFSIPEYNESVAEDDFTGETDEVKNGFKRFLKDLYDLISSDIVSSNSRRVEFGIRDINSEEYLPKRPKGVGEDARRYYELEAEFYKYAVPALNNMGFSFQSPSKWITGNAIMFKKSATSIAEAYHKAKKDGSNPELVKAVEDLLGIQPAAQTTTTKTKDKETTTTSTPIQTELENIGKTPKAIQEQIYKFFTSKIPGLPEDKARELAVSTYVMWDSIGRTLGGAKGIDFIQKKLAQIGQISTAKEATKMAKDAGGGIKFGIDLNEDYKAYGFSDRQAFRDFAAGYNKTERNIMFWRTKNLAPDGDLWYFSEGKVKKNGEQTITIGNREIEIPKQLAKIFSQIAIQRNGEIGNIDTRKSSPIKKDADGKVLFDEWRKTLIDYTGDFIDSEKETLAEKLKNGEPIDKISDRISKAEEVLNLIEDSYLLPNDAKIFDYLSGRTFKFQQDSTDPSLIAIEAEKINNAAITHLTELIERGDKMAAAEKNPKKKKEIQDSVKSFKQSKILLERARKDPKFSVDAYHGTPYIFDKFTTEKIGTGEGAQAFGWGLYFTELDSIAKHYAKSLSNVGFAYKISFKNDVEDNFLGIFKRAMRDSGEELWFIDTPLKLYSYAKKVFDKNYKGGEDTYTTEKGNSGLTPRGKFKKFFPKIDELNQMDFVKYSLDNNNNVNFPKGNIYKVSLHEGKTPDQYNWLEWDKELSQKQIQDLLNKDLDGTVAEALTNHYSEFNDIATTKELITTMYNDGVTGKDLYKILERNVGENPSPKDASISLLNAGIDGIKYPAESISRRTTADNARGSNYVVFDENAVTIKERIQFQQDAARFRAAAIDLGNNTFILAALQDPTITSPSHEFFHAAIEGVMTPEEQQAFIEEYNKEFGDKATSWNTDVSEYTARTYEKYLSNGRKLTAAEVKDTATRNKLQKAFDNFTEWAKNLYNSVIEYNNSKGVTKPINLTPQAQAFFDRVTGINTQTQTDENNKKSNNENNKGEEGKMDTPLDKEQGRKESGTEEEVINKAVESVIGKSMDELIKDPKAMMDYIATVKLGKKDCK